MALFGEFLIKLGLVKETAVLEALVAQAASGLTLCQAVHQGQLLNSNQQLQIFSYQAQHKVDYLQAAIATGIWNPALEQRAMDLIHRHQKPLGHFLLSTGSISFDELIKALDEYVVQNPELPAPIPLRPTSLSSTLNFNFPVFAEDVLEEFLQTFRREQLGSFESSLARLASGEGDGDTLQRIHEGCQRIRSSSRLLRAEMTEALCDHLCGFLEGPSGEPPQIVGRMLTDCIRELSHLRDFIERDLTEKAYFDSPDRRLAFDTCCERLRPPSARKRRTAS